MYCLNDANPTTEFYPCKLKLDGSAFFAIWYLSGEVDAFATIIDGRIAMFEDFDALRESIVVNNVTLKSLEVARFDYDQINVELSAWKFAMDIDCEKVLDGWNTLIDVAESLRTGTDLFLSHKRKNFAIYEKLFYGCNLPKITPEGQEYHPIWCKPEVAAMSYLFGCGLTMLRRGIARAETHSTLLLPVSE